MPPQPSTPADEDGESPLPEDASPDAIDREIARLENEAALLAAQTAADVAGVFDPTPISDTVALAIALGRRDFVGAGLSVVSYVPYLGDLIAKPIKAARLAAASAKIAKGLKALKLLKEKAARRLLKARSAVEDKLGAWIGKRRSMGQIARKREGRYWNKRFPTCSPAALENAIAASKEGYDVAIVGVKTGPRTGHAIALLTRDGVTKLLSEGRLYDNLDEIWPSGRYQFLFMLPLDDYVRRVAAHQGLLPPPVF
jgi:hypothetical protein